MRLNILFYIILIIVHFITISEIAFWAIFDIITDMFSLEQLELGSLN